MRIATILLVGTDESVTATVRKAIASTGFCRLETVGGTEAALTRLQRGDVGLVLVWLPNPTAEDDAAGLLDRIAKSTLSSATPSISTVVLCERGSVELSRRMLNAGAVDCMARPFDVSRLALLADLFTVRSRYQVPLKPRPPQWHVPPDDRDRDDFALGTAVMNDFLERLYLVAPLDTTILITGETGTGKTHLAQVIHARSSRRQKPFVVVPCGALSATLIESEMFGHVRGAFTHAERERIGRFAQVEDGTLLLDEIDCVPLDSQARLLRACEERVFEPVGSDASKTFRGRLIVASNRPLEQEVEAGRFRSDLYYRLNVIDFHIPPLRGRPEMVGPLAEKFLAQFSVSSRRPAEGFSGEAMALLQSYAWPGNVRELRNVVEHTMAFCPARAIEVDDLPETIRTRGAAADGRIVLDIPVAGNGNGLAEARTNAEKGRLLQALRHTGNNRSNAALELGVSRVTLYKKLRKYGLA